MRVEHGPWMPKVRWPAQPASTGQWSQSVWRCDSDACDSHFFNIKVGLVILGIER